MSYPICKLKEGRERSVANRHPWIFSGAIEEMDQDLEPGTIVDVISFNEVFLARGYYNPNSQIRVRVLTFAEEEIDKDFFASRLSDAFSWRKNFIPENTNAYRVCYSEGDHIPGLIVDRYDDLFVAQFLTTGIEKFKSEIADALLETFSPSCIYEKSEGGYRKEEGLPQISGPLYGPDPEDEIRIVEQGLPLLVDVKSGQKTGFFLDQRHSRKIARSIADGHVVLNCFGYTGAFTVACLAGGAKRVITIDTSKNALELAKKNVELNGFDVNEEDFITDDIFQFLREAKGMTDFIILDPPAFAKSRSAVQRASRGYKDINFNALRLLSKNSLLMTFSCSGHVNAELFQKILFAASQDAGRELQILSKISHNFDHPISIYHPEGEYLTGALCMVDESS